MQLTPRSKRRLSFPRVEWLEDRTVPAILPTWDPVSGTLAVVATNHESIAITVLAGNVQVNGADPGTTVPAASVQHLDLSDTGPGPGGSTFDVSDVLHADFRTLAQILVAGGGGSNTLVAPNLSLTWDISGADSGDLVGMTAPLTFHSVGNLDGGTAADDFAFRDTGSLSGRIAGGSGAETLDFSACNNPVAVTLAGSGTTGFGGTAAGFLGGGFGGIDSLVGGNLSSTLTGEDVLAPAAGTWTLASTGTYSDGSATLAFSSFATLKGGAGRNTFDLVTDTHDLGLVTADLYGGSGDETYALTPGGGSSDVIQPNGSSNTLDFSGAATAITIDVASRAAQTVCAGGTVLLQGPIQTFLGSNHGDTFKITAGATASLVGGTGADTFVFTPGALLTGSIDGGPGHDTLDYSAYSTPVNVNLAAGTATAVTGPVAHVEDSAARTAAGNPEVFVIGSDNQVRAELLNAAGYAGGGYFLTAPGAVRGLIATQDASGAPLVFTIGLDNQVHAEDFDPTGRTSHGYFLVATGTVRAIKAGLDATGQPLLLAIRTDGQVWGHTLDGGGHGTGSWYLTQPGQAASLNWGATAAGNVDLFVLGCDGQVRWQKLTATGQPGTRYALATPGVAHDVANDGNLTGLSPAAVDLAFVLIPPPDATPAPAPPRLGRRNGP